MDGLARLWHSRAMKRKMVKSYSSYLRGSVCAAALLAALAGAPHIAHGADVGVRVGEHDGYTRLVFDWPKNAGHEIVNRSESGFEVVFTATGNALQDDIRGRNIAGLEILSTDPLRVLVRTPHGSSSRSFAVESRIVVDIYAPDSSSSGVAASTTAASSRLSPNAANHTPSADVNVTPEASASDQSSLRDVQQALQAIGGGVDAQILNPDRPRPQASVSSAEAEIVSEAQAQAAESEASAAPSTRGIAQRAQEQIRANMFSLSSTASVGLAAFEDAGKLWMVMDRPELTVRPQVSGPNAAQIKELEQIEFEGGKAFVSAMLSETHLRAQGGGILWNVILSPETPEHQALEPIRSDVDKSKIRSGKITLPIPAARKVLSVPDAVSGSILKVVTVEDAGAYSGAFRSFVDFDVLAAPLGVAIRPKVDDLEVKITPQGVEISRPNGLSILPTELVTGIEQGDFSARMARDEDDRRIFNFDEWRLGGLNALNQNRTVILSSMGNLSKSAQIENLITLAKMQLANGRGAEALGFLSYAEAEVPELVQNPEFLSLRGVAKAFSWKTDDAFRDLSSPILKEFEEIGIWRSFALADLGDWEQARDILPNNLLPIKDYPPEIRNRLGIVLAEIFLRAGDVELAKGIFDLIERDRDTLNLAHDAALQYLKGEAARQAGQADQTKELWQALAQGSDTLYRVKAGLALIRLLTDKGEITPAQAIDSLERLRYAWRGDELEAQVNYWLGRTYFENSEYVKGLAIMREAATLVPGTVLGNRITADMRSIFTDFFIGGNLEQVSPLDAVAVYEEFQELVPAGSRGNQVISNLAEHMVRADLLDRASNLLTYQIDHRLSGDEAAKVATRLAAIQLIDRNGAAALQSLTKAQNFLKDQPDTVHTPARMNELALLRARALSLNNRTGEALKILENMTPSPRVNRLRADIAWQSGYWDDANYALEDVILDENILLSRGLSEDHAMLILQRAVAQNLSGDRIGLANLREKYAAAMNNTSKARLFDVVTRPRQNIGLADRDTLLSAVSEVDLFGEFLNTYRDVNPAAGSN
jgi:tetratricopeptide (TPR) repeat protein